MAAPKVNPIISTGGMGSKKKKQTQEIKMPTLNDLEKMDPRVFTLRTMNWAEADLGLEFHSDSESEEEYEVKGSWIRTPPWLRVADDPSVPWLDLTGGWKYQPDEEESDDGEDFPELNLRGALNHITKEDLDDLEGDEDGGLELDPEGELELTSQFRLFPEEEEGEEIGVVLEDPDGEPPILTRVWSTECDLESYTAKGVPRRGGLGWGGGSVAKVIPPIKAFQDKEPLSGTEAPRFVWEVESETSLGVMDREVQVTEFQDNALFESTFRVWRRTAPGYSIAEGLDEEEDIEELLSTEVLEAIRPIFSRGPLTMAKYKSGLTKALRLPDKSYFPPSLEKLFIKVDVFGVGKISWDDLCDFMQQKYAEKAETEYTSPPIDLKPPGRPIETPHHGPVTRCLALPDHGILTFSEDGIVALWSLGCLPRIWRALGHPPVNLKASKVVDKKSNKWYTDIVLLSHIGKYAITTGEKELQFYDTSTFDPYCQLANLYTVPIHMDARLTGRGNNGLIVVMGDITGTISILVVDDAVNTLRTWSQQRRFSNVPTMKVEDAVGISKGVRYAKYKVHTDMISHILYVGCMNQIVSSSMDPHKSLAIGTIYPTKSATELMEDLTVNHVIGVTDLALPPRPRKSVDESRFPIANGCRTFDVWEEKRWIAAGGLDRLVWVWSLYVPAQPIAKLQGHSSAIFKVVWDKGSETLFSICNEKVIRVWTLYTNTCIHVFDPKETRLRGPTTYCFFPSLDGLFVQTSVEASYIKLKRRGDDSLGVGMTHFDPITAVVYNPQHSLFMTCSSEDILVWDCQSGKLINEFNTIGGDGSMHLDTIASKMEKTMEEESRFLKPVPVIHGREQVDTYDVGTITATALDNIGRRFFTAHSNGVIKCWNFNNGRNLYNLYKPNNNLDICDMHYITINDEHRYIVAVGWDRRVVIYIDTEGPEVVQSCAPPNPPLIFSNKELNHRDDVWAVNFGFPNLIASGDYSGKLLVWNINSGHVVANLHANQCRDRIADKESFITALFFHQNTFRGRTTTYLISAGPFHLIHIWRANNARELNVGSVGWNRPCGSPRDFVTAIRSYRANNFLVTSDTWGCVSIWKVHDALGRTEPTEWFPKGMSHKGRNKLFPMRGETLGKKEHGYGKGPVQVKLVRSWKCHVEAFAALEVCEEYGLIVTGGKDCSVRIWDMEGRFIGILGQPKSWIVGDRTSYLISHPLDVILDLKRVRGLEFFRQKAPRMEWADAMSLAEAERMIQKTIRQPLHDSEIQKRSEAYQKLMGLSVPTITWLSPDAPVGPHRRSESPPTNAEELWTHSFTDLPVRMGTLSTRGRGRKKKIIPDL